MGTCIVVSLINCMKYIPENIEKTVVNRKYVRKNSILSKKLTNLNQFLVFISTQTLA